MIISIPDSQIHRLAHPVIAAAGEGPVAVAEQVGGDGGGGGGEEVEDGVGVGVGSGEGVEGGGEQGGEG